MTGYWWVVIKFAVTASLNAALIFVLLPALQLTAEAASAGEPVTGGRQLALVLAPAATIVLLLLNVTLAIFKPVWRIRRGADAHAAASARRQA